MKTLSFEGYYDFFIAIPKIIDKFSKNVISEINFHTMVFLSSKNYNEK